MEFKTSRVQAPQRAKVPVRRALQEHLEVLAAVEAIVSHAHKMNDGTELPVSGPNKTVRGPALSLADILTEAGARVIRQDEVSRKGYEIRTGQADSKIEVLLEPDLLDPRFTVDGKSYSIQIVRGNAASPPIVLKERRSRVIINAGHPSFATGLTRSRVAGCVALEMASLINTPSGSADSLYELVQSLLATY